jgi:hypothetical protein
MAVIEGDHLVVSAANVPAPVAVRYAWADEAGMLTCITWRDFLQYLFVRITGKELRNQRNIKLQEDS